MKEYIHRSYRRNHGDDYASDAERGKISRERLRSGKYARKEKEAAKRWEAQIMAGPIEAEGQDRAEYAHAAKKEMRNGRAHRQRLKELEKHDGFV